MTRILLFLTAIVGYAHAQYQSVTTTADGTLHSPTNFWNVNSNAIATAMSLQRPVRWIQDGDAINAAGTYIFSGAADETVTVDGPPHAATFINFGDEPVNVSGATIQRGEVYAYTFDGTAITSSNRLSLAPMPDADGIFVRNGNTVNARTITGTSGQITVTNGNGVSGNPTISLPSTITGNRTLQDNLTVQGNTTLGDASGDSVTINAATITAPHANSTAPTAIANVATLDARYQSMDAMLQREMFVFAPLGTAPTVANSGTAGHTGNWNFSQNRAGQFFSASIGSSSAAGWQRARWETFGFFSGQANATLTNQPFALIFTPSLNADNAGGIAITWYFGSSAAANNQGGPLTERSMRVRIACAGGSNFAVTAGIHDGTSERTGANTVPASLMAAGVAIQWLPSGSPPGAGSVLRVLGRSSQATDWTVLTSVSLPASIGAAVFAGPHLELVLSNESTSPVYTFFAEFFGTKLLFRP